MERPTQSEVRKAEHDRIAANARELGELALRKIDAALIEQERVWSELMRWTGSDTMTHDQALAIMWNKRNEGKV